MSYWVIAEPSIEIEGVWVGHALTYDIVSQGTSLLTALDSVAEAVEIILEDDKERGADSSLRRAPYEYWSELLDCLRDGDGPHREPGDGARFFVCVQDDGSALYWWTR